VRRPHGLAGEVSVDVLTSFPERFTPGLVLIWRRGAQERPLTLASVRPHAGRLLLRFEGASDVDAARALGGGDLLVAREEAVPAPDGFFYEHEVKGWRCQDVQGRLLGSVAGLEKTTAGPLLEVDTPSKKGVLVPFVEGIVVRIDRAAREVVLDAPDGLFDL
jgi:16S rRNA processing protein RimM